MARLPASCRKFFVMAGWLAALLSLAAAARADAPKRGGSLTVGIPGEPQLVDPLRSSAFHERHFATPVYEALFDIDTKGDAVPLLAESYTVSPDIKTYVIKLRPNVKFHDGTPFDADAVVANLDRTRNPANGCRCLNYVQDIDSVKAIDPLTVEFRLKEANAAFPTVLADAGGIMVSPAAFKANPGTIGINPVGTGPFKFAEWVRGSHYLLTKNQDYWRPGLPYLDKLAIRGIQNQETMEAAFLSGQLDIVALPSFRFVEQVNKNAKYTVVQPDGFGYEGVYMNVTEPPFDDVRVRRAVAHALDVELLRKVLQYGVPPLAFSPFGPGMAVHQPVPNRLAYDPAKAKALLAEYGKPVAFPLQLNNTPSARLMGQAMQEMWTSAGITVELQPLELNRLVQNMNAKQFVASIYRWTGRADPHMNTYSFFHSRYADVSPSQNYFKYANPKVDALLDQGVATLDFDKRKAIYGEVAEVLAQDVPLAFTFYVADTIVTYSKVKGVTPIGDGILRYGSIWLE